MAIEISPRPKIKKISFADIIFYSVLILFLALIAAYFGLNFYQKKLETQLTEIKKSLEKTDAEKAMEEEIFGSEKKIGYQQKLRDFGSLLSAHKSPVNIFNFLEENTHPRVWFSSFSFDVEKGFLDLAGSAENYEALGQQIIIFRELDAVRETSLSRMSLATEGEITFTFHLVVDPKIFK